MMYKDFETILYPIQGPYPEEQYTKGVNQHIPSGFCIYGKFAYGEVENPLRLYRGKDCVEKFCNHIKEEAKRLYLMFPEKPMDPLTNKQWTRYNNKKYQPVFQKNVPNNIFMIKSQNLKMGGKNLGGTN